MANLKFVRSKLRNSTGVFFALFAGQGISLIIYLYMMGQGEAALVGEFGLAMQLCSLALFIVDFGGQVYLAKVAAYVCHVGSRERLSFIKCLFAFRLCAAFLVSFAFLVFYFANLFPDSTTQFMLMAIPSLFFYVWNVGGVLDGRGRQVMNSITNSLYMSLPSMYLFIDYLFLNSGSLWYGIAFSASVLAAVVIQIWAVCHDPVLRLTFADVFLVRYGSFSKAEAREMLDIFLSGSAGQFLNRGQVVIAGLFLDGPTLGYFAFAKQLANGLSQATGVFRRIEFPELVQMHISGGVNSILSAFRFQILSITSAISLGFGVPSSIIIFSHLADFDDKGFLYFIVALMPAYMMSSIYSVATQYLIVDGRSKFVSAIGWASTAIILILYFALLSMEFVIFALLIEFVVYLIVVSVMIKLQRH